MLQLCKPRVKLYFHGVTIGLYFVPYALMVGELGSVFKDGKAVVSMDRKYNGKVCLFAIGLYISYLAQKPQAVLIALGWAVKGDGTCK